MKKQNELPLMNAKKVSNPKLLTAHGINPLVSIEVTTKS